jgi:predicted ATP-dependent serine protease
VKKIRPALQVVYSNQTIFSSDIPSAPGSNGQVR